MATWRYLLETLSPLHIGSGQEYGVFDGVYADGRWYLIDIEKVLERSREDASNLANAMMRPDFNWASWLHQRRILPEEVAARTITCRQNPARNRIRACIRDPFGQPYIPGSTLKGAIRTAILEWLVSDLDESRRKQLAQKVVQRDERGRLPAREHVGRRTLERQLLIGGRSGRNESNYDLLRALHVADSDPLAPEQVEIGLVWVYTLQGNRLQQKRVGN
ncbi:MAG: type III-A CRISPR-associated RAMP protein Csm5, partial [Armatimonadota bacterium]